ncbi:response regulator [Pedomonas mirosovicensis]|uniref:response regulator n=1 Tax=Pedomonas mirosovicensis TaxID=2908641 RepID=UPI0021670C54|nr:response regulator [Pedomonas mirosovicensis]MCH8684235.1 response regulator [Pedomonas mirosovicensis]
MTLFTLSPSLLRGLACAVWLAVLIALMIRRPAWRASPGGLRLVLAGLAVVGAGVLIGAAFTVLHQAADAPDRIAMEAVGLIAGGLALAGVLRYRPVLLPGQGNENRRALASVVERAQAGVMVAALDKSTAAFGPVIYANPEAQGWLQRSIETDQPPTLAGLFTAAGRSGLWPVITETLCRNEPVCELLTLPGDKEDQAQTVRLILAPAQDGAAGEKGHTNLVLAILEMSSGDVSSALERLQAESEAAMTRLAAGLAHDFSNVLTVILTASEILLMEEEGLPASLRRRIERMHSAAQRGADLTDKLRAFAGRLDLMAEELDLHTFLREQAVEFKSVLGPEIELYYDLADGECPVLLDPTRMRAALVNVLAYCQSVLPEGGRVSFRSRFEAMSRQEGAPPDAVVLTIARSGTRLDMEDARRLLEEPYSSGTSSIAGGGFGLSLVAGFIRQSGGQAQFVEEPGCGPVLEIELPLFMPVIPGDDDLAVLTGRPAEPFEAAPDLTGAPQLQPVQAAAPDASQAEAAPVKVAPAAPHVLVVDDDDLMREATIAELASLGCPAATAATADEALALLEKDASITSVLADLGLEGERSGLWLAQQIGARFPHLRVVLMSGDITGMKTVENGNTMLLPKPFSRAQLAASLDLPPRA